MPGSSRLKTTRQERLPIGAQAPPGADIMVM